MDYFAKIANYPGNLYPKFLDKYENMRGKLFLIFYEKVMSNFIIQIYIFLNEISMAI